VVHPIWSKKKLRPWVIYSAIAFTWLSGIVIHTPVVFETSAVIGGRCYAYAMYKNAIIRRAFVIWYVLSFYVIIVAIFIFCYGRIVATIRRQASIMAAHSGTGSSTAVGSHDACQATNCCHNAPMAEYEDDNVE